MSYLPRSEGQGLRAFRLSDLPERVREYGVFEFERAEVEGNGDEFSALALVEVARVARAAHCPSDRVYWIGVLAWERTMRKFRLDPDSGVGFDGLVNAGGGA